KSKGKFSGAEAGLEVELPKIKGWAWNENDCVGDDAIRMDGPDGSCQVRIEVDGNMENTQLADEAGRSGPLTDQIRNRLSRQFGAPDKFDVDEKKAAAGIESVWQFLFNGTEQAMSYGQKVRDGEQRVWVVVIGGPEFKRTYQIICIANKDAFDENKPAFDKIVNSFKMLKDN
ncbi:MAG TPA: hypothetical protein VHF22_11015, partial [Planctomycetota bacterium]|nr:hypothetical protein [Planctomycetota bacterium]